MINQQKTTIAVIPTFNESQNILTLIDNLLSVGIHILVIDDNSPDGTFDIVEKHIEFNNKLFGIKRLKRRSYAQAVIEGFDYALKNEYFKIIQMDSDLSHRKDDLIQMLEKMETNLVIGSRYVKGGEIVGWKIHRRILSKYSNKIAKRVLKTKLNDLTSGFRVYDRKVLEGIDFRSIKSNGYAFLVEILNLVIKNQYTVSEFPISFVDRTNGKSKMSVKIILESALNLFKLYIKNKRKTNQLNPSSTERRLRKILRNKWFSN